MGSSRQIDILISTYNGERYLEAQLESIFSQDVNCWRILIRDDGSNDKSVLIIEKYASRYPDKITVITEPRERLGVCGSYGCLLSDSTAPYAVFCDQDDVWLPNKLRILKKRMQQEEHISGLRTPILVHSDLYVVADNLAEVADSFWEYQNLNPDKMQSLERLLIQNCVTGCASMVNRALVAQALPIPSKAIMHDWWFALIAAAKGRIVGIADKTVQYRQHDANDIGAKKWGVSYVFNNFLFKRPELRQSLLETREQAVALLQSGKLNEQQLAVVSGYLQMFEGRWISRRAIMIRNRYFMYGFMRNLAVLVLL